MIVTGYKAFTKDFTGEQDFKFEENHTYHIDGPIIPGNSSNPNGFHFCTHLSDVFRFYPEKSLNECHVAKVEGFNELKSFDICDWTYPYDDLYVASDIFIDHFLTREEVINIILNAHPIDICKFLIFFKLTTEEIKLFVSKYPNEPDILKSILYYQLGEKNIYNGEQNYLEAKKKLLLK